MRPDDAPLSPFEKLISRWLFPLTAVAFGGWMVVTKTVTGLGILLVLAFMSPRVAPTLLRLLARTQLDLPDDERTGPPSRRVGDSSDSSDSSDT